MRRNAALVMTTWAGIVIAVLVIILEIFLFAGLTTLTPFRYNTPWWPIWILLCFLNGFVVSSIGGLAERLRREGKAILAAKVDTDPEETVG